MIGGLFDDAGLPVVDCREEPRPGFMTVTIPARDQHAGLHSRSVTIATICPRCGGPRGVPFATVSYDGSRRLAVHGWRNPCGHADYYYAVRREADGLLQRAEPVDAPRCSECDDPMSPDEAAEEPAELCGACAQHVERDEPTPAMMWTELVSARASMRSIAATLGDSFQARLLTDAVREIDDLIGPAQAGDERSAA